MKYLVLLLLFIAVALPVPAAAQDMPKGTIPNFTEKEKQPEQLYDWDAIPEEYRTTREQLEAEAFEVYTMCSQNGYQARYYSCECISGAFLIEREKVGPAPSIQTILKKVTASTSPSCANVPQIAANTYFNCMRSASVFRETDMDNEDYCKCVSNTTAKQFEKKPNFEPAYIAAVQSYANQFCESPANRPAPVTTPAEDPLGIKIPKKQ